MAAAQIIVRLAGASDVQHISSIINEIESSAKIRGTGICKRSPQQLEDRIKEGAAVIAVTGDNEWVGFCYIKAWDNDRFVSTCALIVSPLYRKSGVATQLKEKAFHLARTKYPAAKLFGLTTSLAVMKINTGLGFRPVTYTEITKSETFWAACQSCPNYGILMGKDRKACLCTAMLFEAIESSGRDALAEHNRTDVQEQDETWLQKKFEKRKAVM